MTRREIERRVQGLVNAWQNIVQLHEAAGSWNSVTACGVDFGRRYARLTTIDQNPDHVGGYSACGFVDLTNGDILYAGGWNKPTKRKRGSVLDEDYGASAMRWHGVKNAGE